MTEKIFLRDKSHEEQIIRHARYVKNNPLVWKKQHTLFIDAQMQMAEAFFQRLEKTEEGRKILRRLIEAKRQKSSIS